MRDGISADLNPHLFAPPPFLMSSPGSTGRSSNPHSLDNENQGLLDARLRRHDEEKENSVTFAICGGASGIGRASLEKLASADAFRSLGLDRRQALWEVRGLPKEIPLPLFDHAACRRGRRGAKGRASHHAALGACGERLPHASALAQSPSHELPARPRGARAAFVSCADLKTYRDGATRERRRRGAGAPAPRLGAGVVFMTIEDETGIANSVIWPKVLERMRKVVMGARLVVVHGRVQRHEDIIHVVAERLEDRSDWLRLLDRGRRELERRARQCR